MEPGTPHDELESTESKPLGFVIGVAMTHAQKIQLYTLHALAIQFRRREAFREAMLPISEAILASPALSDELMKDYLDAAMAGLVQEVQGTATKQ